MRISIMAVLLSLGGVAMADPLSPAAFVSMSQADQKTSYAKLTRDEQSALLAALSPAQLVALAREMVRCVMSSARAMAGASRPRPASSRAGSRRGSRRSRERGAEKVGIGLSSLLIRIPGRGWW